MSKTVFMKAGESIREIQKGGRLYRNVIQIEKMEANMTHMLPGTKSKPFKHKGQEIHVMIRGKVEFTVGDEKFLLKEGDMLFHHSSEPHSASNKGRFEAVFVTISTPPTFTLFKD